MSKQVRFSLVHPNNTQADLKDGIFMGIAANLRDDPRVDNVDLSTNRRYMGGEGTDDNYTLPEDIWEDYHITFTCDIGHKDELQKKVEDLISDVEPTVRMGIYPID